LIRTPSVSGFAGDLLDVPVLLDAQGDESAVGFSISFDPAALVLEAATPGEDLEGGSIQVNRTLAAVGEIGCAVALANGAHFAAGEHRLLHLKLRVASTQAGIIPLEFADTPVVREVASPLASAIPANFVAGAVTQVGNPPTLRVSFGASAGLRFEWARSSLPLVLEESPDLSPGHWTAVDVQAVEAGGGMQADVPVGTGIRFFRLR